MRIVYLFLIISLISISCKRTEKVEKSKKFTKSLELSWKTYLKNSEEAVKVTKDIKKLYKIKNSLTDLYMDARDEYDEIPEDLTIKIARVMQQIELKVKLGIGDQYHKNVIDIIPHKVRKNYFIGAYDDGSVKSLTDKDLPTKYIWPLKNIEITSNYGFRDDPFTGKLRFHSGVDLSAPIGTKIYSSSKGRVLFANSNGGYGLTIIIQHSKKVITLYAHLNKIDISEGDYVKRGEIIGEVGNSGRSTGPHLHFEIRKNGEPNNPILFLEKNGSGG